MKHLCTSTKAQPWHLSICSPSTAGVAQKRVVSPALPHVPGSIWLRSRGRERAAWRGPLPGQWEGGSWSPVQRARCRCQRHPGALLCLWQLGACSIDTPRCADISCFLRDLPRLQRDGGIGCLSQQQQLWGHCFLSQITSLPAVWWGAAPLPLPPSHGISPWEGASSKDGDGEARMCLTRQARLG